MVNILTIICFIFCNFCSASQRPAHEMPRCDSTTSFASDASYNSMNVTDSQLLADLAQADENGSNSGSGSGSGSGAGKVPTPTHKLNGFIVIHDEKGAITKRKEVIFVQSPKKAKPKKMRRAVSLIELRQMQRLGPTNTVKQKKLPRSNSFSFRQRFR